MEKLFVSYEQAMKLKNLGFEESCLGWYAKDGSFYLDKMTIHQGLLLAPLLTQAIDWFRTDNKMRLSGTVKHYTSGTYSFVINKHNGGDIGWERLSSFIEKGFYNYHDAESACLNRIIEIVEETLKENPPFKSES